MTCEKVSRLSDPLYPSVKKALISPDQKDIALNHSESLFFTLSGIAISHVSKLEAAKYLTSESLEQQ